MEAGAPPRTFEEWVAAITRDGRWIDGAWSMPKRRPWPLRPPARPCALPLDSCGALAPTSQPGAAR
eukprot:2967983-Alexandrium_andersonii.AAC.1